MKKGGHKIQKIQNNESMVKPMQNNSNYEKKENDFDENRYTDEIKKLKLLIQQRDNEISLLLSLINKKKNESKEVTIPVHRNSEEDKLLQSVVKDKPI